MNNSKKLIVLAPVIAFLVIFIFSLTLFPSVKVQPKSLPIAIVNEDQGVEIANQPAVNMGQTIVDMVQQTSSSTADEEPAVQWVIVHSTEEVTAGLNDMEYYAALVIPEDFSSKQASLRTTTPSSPEVQIYINQGMNTAASTVAGQVLNGVVDNMNNNVRTQILEGFKSQGAMLTTEQASTLATPIVKKVTNVNEIGTNSASGNSPVSLFQPLWMACLASSAILFIGISKLAAKSRKEMLTAKLIQIGMGAIAAVIVGFGLTWLAESFVGLHIPQYVDTALFLTITCFSFILMISAVISWLGIKGIAIFALLLFFGAPLLALAPEMMSPFYRDYIHSWLPMRFMVDGLRELFFFDKGLSWNRAVASLTWIGSVSAVVILGSAFKPRAVQQQQQSLEG
jgi:Predicted membrane protein